MQEPLHEGSQAPLVPLISHSASVQELHGDVRGIEMVDEIKNIF